MGGDRLLHRCDPIPGRRQAELVGEDLLLPQADRPALRPPELQIGPHRGGQTVIPPDQLLQTGADLRRRACFRSVEVGLRVRFRPGSLRVLRTIDSVFLRQGELRAARVCGAALFLSLKIQIHIIFFLGLILCLILCLVLILVADSGKNRAAVLRRAAPVAGIGAVRPGPGFGLGPTCVQDRADRGEDRSARPVQTLRLRAVDPVAEQGKSISAKASRKLVLS